MASKKVSEREFFDALVVIKKNRGDVYDLARELALRGFEMDIKNIRGRVSRMNNKYCEYGRISIPLKMPVRSNEPYVGYDEWKNAADEISKY